MLLLKRVLSDKMLKMFLEEKVSTQNMETRLCRENREIEVKSMKFRARFSCRSLKIDNTKRKI